MRVLAELCAQRAVDQETVLKLAARRDAAARDLHGGGARIADAVEDLLDSRF